MQFLTTMSRSQLCLCMFRPRRSSPVWCIKIPSAYVVAQAVYFLDEELRLNAGAPMFAFVAVQRSPCGGACCGMDWSCCGDPNVCSSHNIRMWERDGNHNNGEVETWVLRSNTSGYSSCFCSPLWTTRLRSQSDLWMRSAYQPDCCFCCFPLPRAWLFFVLLFKCCETLLTEVLASKCCSVMGWACSVFGCRLHLWSPSGPAGENVTSTPPPVMILHCLILPLFQNKKNRKPFSSSKQSSLHLAVMETHWCWVFRFCLFIKVECWLVFYPGARVSLCRHVRVPPISDCALIHELIFCGTWPAWIHFVYICTLILFTV